MVGGGGQFVVRCAVFLFGSTRSFPDRREPRATNASPYWVRLESQLSASLLMASGGGSDAAAVWVLEKGRFFFRFRPLYRAVEVCLFGCSLRYLCHEYFFTPPLLLLS